MQPVPPPVHRQPSLSLSRPRKILAQTAALIFRATTERTGCSTSAQCGSGQRLNLSQHWIERKLKGEFNETHRGMFVVEKNGFKTVYLYADAGGSFRNTYLRGRSQRANKYQRHHECAGHVRLHFAFGRRGAISVQQFRRTSKLDDLVRVGHAISGADGHARDILVLKRLDIISVADLHPRYAYRYRYDGDLRLRALVDQRFDHRERKRLRKRRLPIQHWSFRRQQKYLQSESLRHSQRQSALRRLADQRNRHGQRDGTKFQRGLFADRICSFGVRQSRGRSEPASLGELQQSQRPVRILHMGQLQRHALFRRHAHLELRQRRAADVHVPEPGSSKHDTLLLELLAGRSV